MGTFRIEFTVANPAEPSRHAKVQGLVDTGASLPFIPETVLRSLGVEPAGEETFVLADGSKRTYSIGEARLILDGRSAPCLVVFSPEGTETLLGALALESLRLEVDPVNRKLKPATLYLA